MQIIKMFGILKLLKRIGMMLKMMLLQIQLMDLILLENGVQMFLHQLHSMGTLILRKENYKQSGM